MPGKVITASGQELFRRGVAIDAHAFTGTLKTTRPTDEQICQACRSRLEIKVLNRNCLTHSGKGTVTLECRTKLRC